MQKYNRKLYKRSFSNRELNNSYFVYEIIVIYVLSNTHMLYKSISFRLNCNSVQILCNDIMHQCQRRLFSKLYKIFFILLKYIY